MKTGIQKNRMKIFSLINIVHAQELIPCPDGTMADAEIGCTITPKGIVDPEIGLLEIILKFGEMTMNIIASLAIIVLIYGGIRYAMGRGNEEDTNKAKRIIKWSIIGLILGLLTKYIIQFIFNLIS